MHFPPGHFVFVDLETTGAKASHDRITEVGLIEVLDGEVIDEFTTLVNPRVSVSAFITSLTGITNAMVTDAPDFADIAEDLLGRLLDKTLVAHNARFDYSFLKNEFRRLGLDYRARVLCTVKLSRALMPEVRSHRLDNLIQLHGLMVENRHRAQDDAEALIQLMSRWSRVFGEEPVAAQIQSLLKTSSVPPQLELGMIEDLPNQPGVYLFYDEKNTLLYVGKSVKIRDRVKSHFSGDHSSNKELELSQRVTRIDYQQTGGDLGAQLLESQLIKQNNPIFNRQLRKTKNLWYFELSHDRAGYYRVAIKNGDTLPVEKLNSVLGLFRSKKMAESALREMVEEEHLCHRLTGLEKSRGEGACFAHQLHRCGGACIEKEPADTYNRRLEQAVAPWRFQVWPADGPLVIKEAGSETTQYHLVHHWCHLTSAASESGLAIAEVPLRFEYDTYKILLKFMNKPRRNMDVYPYGGAVYSRQSTVDSNK